MSNVGIVYLIQPAELVGTNRFKVGCSSKNTIDRCVEGYRKGTRCIYIIECIEPFCVEKILKNAFTTNFKLIAGKEYFEGDEIAIKKLFINIVFTNYPKDEVLNIPERVIDNNDSNNKALFELFEFTEDTKDKITNKDLKLYLKRNKVKFQYKQVKLILKTRGCNDYNDNSGKYKGRGLNGLKKVNDQADTEETIINICDNINDKESVEKAKIIINTTSKMFDAINEKESDVLEPLDDNYIIFEQHVISIIMDTNDILWFNANDLTAALGYTEAKRMIQLHINKKDKIQLKNINHNYNIVIHPNSIYLNESGLYTLLIKSNKPNAKKFTAWITTDVLPSIRKYGYYKMKNKFENDKTGLLEQINYLQKQNKTMESNLKKDKYPEGNLVYIMDYSDEDTTLPGIYRLGMTKNLKARKELYDTHTLNKKKVLHYELVKDPIRLEYCLRSMLYKYRYRVKKDFYICSPTIIKKAFKQCSESLNHMNSNVQTGGGLIIDKTLTKLQNKLVKLDKEIYKYKLLSDF